MFRIIPQLTVDDVAISREFYVGRLGFNVTMDDPPESPVFVALEREDASLFLVSRSSREEEYQVRDLLQNKCGVGVRLYLEVDDATELYEQLKSQNVKILREIAFNEREAYHEFSFADPDGYEIGAYS